MPGPCSGKNLISILVTDYIQKRRGQALHFSFEYNLLPILISNFNHYMDRALASYFGDAEKFSMVFPVVFQASTGKKHQGKNHGTQKFDAEYSV